MRAWCEYPSADTHGPASERRGAVVSAAPLDCCGLRPSVIAEIDAGDLDLVEPEREHTREAGASAHLDEHPHRLALEGLHGEELRIGV
ncbi:MAG: hypothetical protein GY938_04240 [Ketobacter sp.]|nr:hypothetical protein [Ketobacter sp.]